VETVVVGSRVADIIANPSVNKRMAGVIADIVAKITAKISQSPFSLLLGFNFCNVFILNFAFISAYFKTAFYF